MDDVGHAKHTRECVFSSEVCNLKMRVKEDWSSIALELENIKDSKMFSKEYKMAENMDMEAIETIFSIFEEINGEVKEKHGPNPLAYDFGTNVTMGDYSLMIDSKEDHAIVEIGWVMLIGKKEKKSKKVFQLDYTGKTEQYVVSKFTINNIEKKIRSLEI